MEDKNYFNINDDNEWDLSLDLTPFNETINVITDKNDEKDNRGLERSHVRVLSNSFGHTTFRTLQWKIIRSVMIEKKDVCAIMATGYGKSLCYQFPSVYSGGVTIVISPLISLMEDQVLSLKMSNIPACLLGSAQTQKSKVLTEIMSNKYRIVYATPEFCTGEFGIEFLQNVNNTLNVDLLAIDEAHCVSQWGHDFRVKYRHLSKIRKVLTNVPILAVTATATKDVRTDIITSLKLRNPNVYCSGFDRPNLFFEVILRTSTDPIANLRPFMINDSSGLTFAGSTIIYCLTKKQTEEVAKSLTFNRIECLMYHASLSLGERKRSHEKFAKDEVKVIVATIAFGMGIDKPDVRMVIHYGASKDLESYYQEVGRAGRDGLSSRCILLHHSSDFHTHENIREYSSFGNSSKQNEHRGDMSKIMQKYIDSLECRRKFILEYFQDDTSHCKEIRKDCCDNCKMKYFNGKTNFYSNYDGLDENGKYNLATEAKLMLELIKSLNGRYGMGIYIFTLRGSTNSKVSNICQQNSLYGAGKQFTETWWKYVGSLLEREGLLKKVRQNTGTYSYSLINISWKGEQLLNDLKGDKEYRVMPTKEMIDILKNRKKSFKVVEAPSTSKISTKVSEEKGRGRGEDFKDFKDVLKGKEMTKKTVLKIEEENPVHKKYRMDLYNKLMKLRSDLAHEKDCMPYMVISNTALMSISKLRPRSLDDLRTQAYDGFTEAKITNFGQSFIDFLSDYYSKFPPPPPDGNSTTNEDIPEIKKPNFKTCTFDDSDENDFVLNDKKTQRKSTDTNKNFEENNMEKTETEENLNLFVDLLNDNIDVNTINWDDWEENPTKRQKVEEKSNKKPVKKKSKTDWSWD